MSDGSVHPAGQRGAAVRRQPRTARPALARRPPGRQSRADRRCRAEADRRPGRPHELHPSVSHPDPGRGGSAPTCAACPKTSSSARSIACSRPSWSRSSSPTARTMPQHLLDQCNTHHVALFTSPQPSPHLVDVIRLYLARVLAESTTLHGVFLDVLEMGVLITGASAIGKSELALGAHLARQRPRRRRHRRALPHFARHDRRPLPARCCATFSKCAASASSTSARSSARPPCARASSCKLLVHLEDHGHEAFTELDRLQVNATYQDVLAVPIRKVTIPVAGGPQPRGAGRGRGAQFRAQPARHRQHEGVHRAAAEADGRWHLSRASGVVDASPWTCC